MTSSRCLLLCFALLFTPGCLLVSVTTPLDTDVNATELGSRTGEASFHSVLYLVSWGDAGTQAAADAGGITTVRHLDQHLFSLLFGLYFEQTTIAYGD